MIQKQLKRRLTCSVLAASSLALIINLSSTTSSYAASPEIGLKALIPGITGIVYPLIGTRVSSRFGGRKHPVLKVHRHHSGVDLAAPKGTPIRAILEGHVVFADPYGGYGNLVVVKHKNEYTSHYGHCDQIKVKTGQWVKAGHILGTVGTTGRVSGPHLHFEIRNNGKVLDPESLVPNLAEQAEG